MKITENFTELELIPIHDFKLINIFLPTSERKKSHKIGDKFSCSITVLVLTKDILPRLDHTKC